MTEDLGTTAKVVDRSLAEVDAIIATLRAARHPFARPSKEAWSPGEIVEHLRLAVRPLNFALGLPRFVLALFGRPRGSRSYEQVVEKYRARLAEGARATAPFVPPRLLASMDTEVLVGKFREAYLTYGGRLVKAGASLDTGTLPHPILGRLSLREMSFFILYHLRHHHEAMRRRTEAGPAPV